MSLEYDDKVIQYYQRGAKLVEDEEDADYMMVTYLLNNEVVGKEQLLAEHIVEQLGEDGYSESHLDPMNGPLKEDLPVSQAFSSVGRDTDDLKKLGKYFNEKSDTGDDLTRTGPGGTFPRDSYDGVYPAAEKSTTLNAATAIELEEEPQEVYEVDGTVPEYQESIIIEIDEEEKKIEIEIKDENQEESIELQPGDLKNHEGRKDPGTHTNTIKAGEKDIDKLLPISDIWKTPNDGMAETKQFSFIGDSSFKETEFTQPSSWIGTVTWNPQSLDATVVMNGKAYNHSGVTGKDFESFKGAPSKGAHWNRFWKGQFPAAFSEALNISQKHPHEFDWIDEKAIDEMMRFTKENGKRYNRKDMRYCKLFTRDVKWKS